MHEQNAMYEQTEPNQRPEPNTRPTGNHQTPGRGWCALDPGDTHDKGEESLCVGEAA
jgi:hypothetical protein